MTLSDLSNPLRPHLGLFQKPTLYFDPLQTLSDPLGPSQTLSDPLRPSQSLSDPLRPSQTLSNPLRPSQTLSDLSDTLRPGEMYHYGIITGNVR